MRHIERDGCLTIWLEGRIGAGNAADIEAEIDAVLKAATTNRVQIDGSLLSYLSSSGLRIIVRMLKRCERLSIVNVAPEVYDVLKETGLADIMAVSKRLREQSIEGLRQIGAGAFGRVYHLDDERIIKVYDPQVNPLDKIERERKSAREAFIHGIPSAIPFETVRVGAENGIIYELMNAKTLGEAASSEPDRVEEYATRMAELLAKLHSTHFERGQLPDARNILFGWIDVAERSDLYAPGTIELLRQSVAGIEDTDTFVHGDFHPANIMVMPDGELMLIDMGDASMGSPDIDLAGTFHVLRIAARRPGGAERLCGMPPDLLDRLWIGFVRRYFGVRDEDEIAAIEQRLRIVALPRTMGSTARSKLISDEQRRQQARQLEQAFLSSYGRRWAGNA